MSEEHNKEAHTPDEVIVESKGTSSGSSADNDKVLAAVSAIPIVGLIVFFAMKDASPYVKNYARQGGTLFIISIVSMLLGVVPILGGLLACLVSIAVVVGIIILLIKALQEDKTYQLPVIGDFSKSIFK
jgi:uncharacterized membrane protein